MDARESRPIEETLIYCGVCDEFYTDGENHEESAEHRLNYPNTAGAVREKCEEDGQAFEETSADIGPTYVTRVYCGVCDHWYVQGEKHLETTEHIRNIYDTTAPIVEVEAAVQRRIKTYFLNNLKIGRASCRERV